jgi:putative colanic acid biosynthesis UDP-glucose lipid carrier transferase
MQVREPAFAAPATMYASRLKRVFDIIASFVLIILLLSWITPVLFVLIRLGSRGPLFFVQKRTGLAGKSFSCLKFRTMRLSELSDTLQANADDVRITRLGRLLRITHIDELPQLVNVLLNDMSLVGPRPHMISHDQLFSTLLPDYRLRHLVKPGITGLAQAAGYHGATPDFFSISNRTRLDLFYVKRVSFGLDVKILLTTLFIVPVKFIKSAHADRY